MKIQYLLLFYCFTFFACNNATKEQREIISGMEAAVEQNTNDQFLRPLISNYINYSVDFPEDEMTPIYLYRCAVLYYRAGNPKEATTSLETILREYPSAPIIEDTYLTLAMICTKGGMDIERATALYTTYKEKYPNGKGIAEVDYFFKPQEDKLADNIKKIQNEIANLPRGQEANSNKYNQLAWAYINFIKIKKDEPLTPAYCMQAARLAIRLDYHLVAVQLLDKIYVEHTDFEQYPEALLLLAVQYDTNIKSYLKTNNVVSAGAELNPRISKELLEQKDVVAEGGKLYKEIIKKFPNHAVALSAKAGLQNLGKRPSKVIEEFLQKQDSIQKAISGQTESGQ